jgi:putative redox protein
VSETKPPAPPPEPLTVDLDWLGDHRFRGRSGEHEVVMDSPPTAGPTPVQVLALGLAGCMAIDVAVVMKRGRFDVESIRARLVAQRAPTDPKRLTRVDLRFTVAGEVPPDRVERAIELSREKFCSVWHSLRPDIELATSFEVLPGTRAPA